MLKRLLLPGVLVLLGSGCGAADRPPPAEAIVTGEGNLSSGPTSTGEPGDAHDCDALSYRDCKITYVDESGQLQCPTQVQICNAEGTAWLACGQYVYDENGEPRPRTGK